MAPTKMLTKANNKMTTNKNFH